ncbi:SH2 domain containing 3Cb [Periophthalmus magnuspinnatus]|uniref:SH2 domain containing 3Cb n=1 Tax=Periophthalmus magnuspinnatus TaxID=409849 RepID=UPI00145BDEA5|nr:SH2 domain containing 3Cb [Periophthalmus magnuspinnatus]
MDRCLDLQDLNQSTDKQQDPNLNQDLYLCEDSKQNSVQDLDQDLDQDSSGYTELVPQSYVERLHIEHQGPDKLKAKNISFSVPESTSCFSPRVEVTSCFRPLTYQSALMSTENRPLEVAVLRKVKHLLAQVHPKMAALHITKADCEVGRVVQVTPQQQRIMGAQSGVELLTLPHGQQLRLDLLERFETMALALAVQVLGCTGSLEERASLVNRLILTASELRSSVGNLFGFGAVMRALQLPQVSRLDQTWVTLRQRHTEGAVLFEKTLRPFMKNLNEGRETCPLSGTCFPHVLPLLVLMERGAPALQRAGEAPGDLPQLWDSDLGVDVFMFHLSAARTMAQLGNVYKTNATSKLQGLEPDSGLEQVFSTEFQMRLLWGHRGASAPQHLRYHKFYQVLTALSHRLEPPRTRTKK